MVPLRAITSVRDLAADLGLPLVIAARPGLGTINHTLLTIECARAAGLDVARGRADALARGSRSAMRALEPRDDRALGDVEVATLPDSHVGIAPRRAARATLPVERWRRAPACAVARWRAELSLRVQPAVRAHDLAGRVGRLVRAEVQRERRDVLRLAHRAQPAPGRAGTAAGAGRPPPAPSASGSSPGRSRSPGCPRRSPPARRCCVMPMMPAFAAE